VADTSGRHPCVQTLAYADYQFKSHGELLSLLRDKHLLVLDVPHPQRRFDKDGLSRLGDLNKEIVVHGKSHFNVISVFIFICIQIIQSPRMPKTWMVDRPQEPLRSS
jgi:hypothetical protein